MKTTLDLPDDLMTAVKLEAVRRRRKLKEFVSELLRDALSRRREAKRTAVLGPAPAKRARRSGGQDWLDDWLKLGEELAENRLAGGPTLVEQLGRDREARC